MKQRWMAVAALIGFLSVAGGAFGAHALEAMIPPERMDTFEIGTRYAQVHAVALLCVAVMLRDQPTATTLKLACAAFTVGVVFFTGSLWLLTVSGVTWLGAITPLGGLAFLTGWASLGVHAMRSSGD
ncbi:MAG: uncharacterized membrane protein YgdD (TMEM256/DUF423 family) [Myxococcota bacterium]|jgi:uncharacterized membrane protein YgdD (TMEM256/DUF423 family)